MYRIYITGDGDPYYYQDTFEFKDEAWLVAADLEATFETIYCQVV